MSLSLEHKVNSSHLGIWNLAPLSLPQRLALFSYHQLSPFPFFPRSNTQLWSFLYSVTAQPYHILSPQCAKAAWLAKFHQTEEQCHQRNQGQLTDCWKPTTPSPPKSKTKLLLFSWCGLPHCIIEFNLEQRQIDVVPKCHPAWLQKIFENNLYRRQGIQPLLWCCLTLAWLHWWFSPGCHKQKGSLNISWWLMESNALLNSINSIIDGRWYFFTSSRIRLSASARIMVDRPGRKAFWLYSIADVDLLLGIYNLVTFCYSAWRLLMLNWYLCSFQRPLFARFGNWF